MININPPLQRRIPPSLAKDPEVAAYLESQKTQLWQIFEYLKGGRLDITGDSDSFNAALSQVFNPETVIYTVTSNHETSGDEFLIVNSSVTITLNPDALENEQVVVFRDTSAGNVSVTDGFGTDILRLDKTVISYRYIIDEGWTRGA